MTPARPRAAAAATDPEAADRICAFEEQLEQLTADIVGALKTVYDPEIPADIYELGLIYKIDIDDDRHVEIDMTLTAPGLPGRGRDADLGRERGQCRAWASRARRST